MKLKKILALVLTVAMVGSVLTACGENAGNDTSSKTTSKSSQVSSTAESTDGESSAKPAETGLYPGTADPDSITINIRTEPPRLNTLLMTDTTSFDMTRHTSEPLARLNDKDTATEGSGAAESWTVSDDGLNYTFKLREGMKWTNGDPVTAKDYEFAWKKLLDPDIASEYAYFLYMVENAEAYNNSKNADFAGDAKTADDVAIKATDDLTLEVKLASPTAYFINMVAFGSLSPINQKFYEEVGAEAYATEADKFCTSGPFKFESWTHDSELIMVKNDDYWDAENIKTKKLIFKMISDGNAALNAFKSGELDVVDLSGDQRTMLEAEGFEANVFNDGSHFYLQMNMKQKGLDNLKVRKAFAEAIDKQAFIDSILKDSSTPATGFVPAGVMGLKKDFADEVKDKFGDELCPAVPNLSGAKALLEEGVAEAGMTMEEFSKSITMVCDDTDRAVLFASFIQEQLNKNLGLDVQVESMPFKSRIERTTNKDFSIVFGGWGPDYNDPNTFLDLWVTDGGNNKSSYSNPEYDKILKEAQVEVDPEKRMEMYYQLEKIVLEELPVAPVYWRYISYAVSDKVTNELRTMQQNLNFIHAEIN